RMAGLLSFVLTRFFITKRPSPADLIRRHASRENAWRGAAELAGRGIFARSDSGEVPREVHGRDGRRSERTAWTEYRARQAPVSAAFYRHAGAGGSARPVPGHLRGLCDLQLQPIRRRTDGAHRAAAGDAGRKVRDGARHLRA